MSNDNNLKLILILYTSIVSLSEEASELHQSYLSLYIFKKLGRAHEVCVVGGTGWLVTTVHNSEKYYSNNKLYSYEMAQISKNY